MWWEVRGTLKASGDEAAITVEADSEDSAARRADRRGIQVESIALIPDRPEDSGVYVAVSEPEPEHNALQDLASAVRPSAVLPYQPQQRRYRPATVTVERTSKFWKAQKVIASLLCIVGVTLACAGVQMVNGPNDGTPFIGGIGGLLLLVGVCWFIIARIGAWWDHG